MSYRKIKHFTIEQFGGRGELQQVGPVASFTQYSSLSAKNVDCIIIEKQRDVLKGNASCHGFDSSDHLFLLREHFTLSKSGHGIQPVRKK